MAGKNPIVVSSIDEALGLLGDFDGAESFIVAPLTDKKGGGRPSWHVLRLDEDGEPNGWIKEAEAEAERDEGREEVSFKVPTVDLIAEDLPALPRSSVNRWQFVFCDGDGEKMEPRIIIDPSVDTSRQSPRRPSAETPKRPPQSAPADSVAAPQLPEAGILRALEIQSRANEKMMQQVQTLLSTVTGSIEQIGKGHAQLGALLGENLKSSERRAEEAEKTRDIALAANLELQNQLTEARSGGQGWLAIKEIYGAKPELLHDGLREIVGGAVSALRAAIAASDAG